MKNMTIRLKTTLWFIIILTIMVSLTYFVFYSVSERVVRNIIQEDVEDIVDLNVDEIIFHKTMAGYDKPGRTSLEVRYKDGYLEIDDDFVSLMSGVVTGLYDGNGELIYGKNPIPRDSSHLTFQDGVIQTVLSGPDKFYVYDRHLKRTAGEDLWLRGVVDQDQREGEVSEILRMSLLLLPLLILIAALGGYFIVRRSLAPISQITETAGKISGGSDLKMRIEENGGDDEVQQLARSFNEMIERLEESFESEKQFTSDVSHELRTPLSVILSQCELSLGDDLTEEEARNALQVVQRQGNQMKDMIDDMLTYTRIDRQHERYPFDTVNFSDIVRNICEEIREIGEKDITIETNIQDDVMLHGSDKMLARMVVNLVNNAIKYGKEEGHVCVSLQEGEAFADAKAGTPAGSREVILCVEDDGIGIEAEQIGKIFDRFYQADPARTDSGIGLGLSMVREIVEKHNGRIEVESTPGEGSAFTIRIPKEL